MTTEGRPPRPGLSLPTTPQELRAQLGMSPGQLLQSQSGHMADILSIEGEFATLGIISSGRQVQVKLSDILSRKPE